MAEDLRRVAELIDFWKKLDLRTFQRELKSVQPELRCLLQGPPKISVDLHASSTAIACTTSFTVDAVSETAIISDNVAPSSQSSSPSTLPPSPVHASTDPDGITFPCPMPTSGSSPKFQSKESDGEPSSKELPPMALKGLFKKIRKFFRVQDVLSLLINYGELLRLVEAVLAKEEPFSELQTFLLTNGRRGRRRPTNENRLRPSDPTEAGADLGSNVWPNSFDGVFNDPSAIVVKSGTLSISQCQQSLQHKHLDKLASDAPYSNNRIVQYCPLTVPKYVPALRPGMFSCPSTTLTSRHDVPSFDRHHNLNRHVAISSSSSSFSSIPLSLSWTSFDTSGPTNGHLCDAVDDYEDGLDDDDDDDDNDGGCIDLRIESKRLSSSSSSAFVTSFGNDGCHVDTQDIASTGVTSDLAPKSKSWDGLNEGEKEACLKMKVWMEDDDVTGHDFKNQSSMEEVQINEACPPKGEDLLQSFQEQQEQPHHPHLFHEACKEVGGAWEALTNGHERTADMLLPLNNIGVNRSIKRKRKDKMTGFSNDSFRAKRFFSGREEQLVPSGGSIVGSNPSMTCDSSSCRRGSSKEDDEKKKATKELISRIYMKELERLVESAEKRGETVELQTYKDELEKIRKNLMVSDEKKTEKEDEAEATFESNKNISVKNLTIGSVSIKSEETINIKAEKEDAQEINFVGGPLTNNCYEAPNQPSPLQRIQSIFNSGIMRPTNHSKSPSIKQNSNHHHHHNRTTLPPIDQHQLEAHLDINTEELVKKVREFLGRFSISQRLFGEKVLGLSQGSVSDLLARPKPWCVLTQKGREPFARMKMFLEDQDGIMTRLLTTQCKVMTSVAPIATPSIPPIEDSKVNLDFHPKAGSTTVQGNQSIASQLSQHSAAGTTPAILMHYEKLSTGKQAIPSLNNPIPLKIPLHHTSSPRNSPKARSPWTSSATTDSLSTAGYLGNFPFSSFLPSVLSMIGSSGQSPLTNPVPPFLSPSPFFPLMVPGYPSMSTHANLLRNLPYGFPCERPGIETSLNLRDNPDQPQNGGSRCSSRMDSSFHLNSSPRSFRNIHDGQGIADDNIIDEPEDIKEESISDSTEPIDKLSEENRNGVTKYTDSTPSNLGSISDDQQTPLPFITVSGMSSANVEKVKAMSDYSFRDVHQFELDTQAITARVKELLQQSNLGQKLFGEAVLELSQGSVSELLSKPKPWALLSLKGREPFIKMNAWLADPHGVEKLRNFHLNNGSVPGNGSNGYRGLGGGTKSSRRKTTSEADSPSSTSSVHPQHRTGFMVDGEKERFLDEEQKKKKRPRLFFTEEQKAKLREAYDFDPYPSQMAIERLARELSVGSKTVVNWFHNHRMRAKQVVATNSNSITHNSFGSIKNIIHQHIFSSALAFQDGKLELAEDVKELSSPNAREENKSGDNLPEESESSGCHVGTSNSSVGVSRRKRSKPLKVPEVPTSQEANSLTEPSSEAMSPLHLMEQPGPIPPADF